MRKLKVINKLDLLIGAGFTFLAIADASNGTWLLTVLDSLLAIGFFTRGFLDNN